MYSIESSTNNMSLQIGILYGKLELLIANSNWKTEFAELMKYRSSIAAITTDKDIFNKLPSDRVASKKMIVDALGENKYLEYVHYKKVLEKINPKEIIPISIESLKDIHNQILPEDEFTLRSNPRLLPKKIRVNNITKEVNLEVKTKPGDVVKKLEEFLKWFDENYLNENPIILAALGHFHISEIHPFSDGNGRLSNILGNIGFAAGNIFSKKIFAIEYYLLQNIEIYYEILEEVIETNDYTKWISFYTEALLASLIDSARLIKKITYGAVDIERNRQVELSDLEFKTLKILSERPNIKIVDMAKELNCSRQNVYRIINKLKENDLIFD